MEQGIVEAMQAVLQLLGLNPIKDSWIEDCLSIITEPMDHFTTFDDSYLKKLLNDNTKGFIPDSGFPQIWLQSSDT